MTGKNCLRLMMMLMATFSLSAFTYPAREDGNGNVVKEERKVTDFKAVTVSSGINLLVSQGSVPKVIVEAEDNLIQYIKTEVAGEVLRIGIRQNNGSFHSHKQINVYVTAKELKAMEANSGSKLKTEGRIQAGEMKISASSGSSVIAEIACSSLDAGSSSGSSGIISGSAKSIEAEGSSGSSLIATDLKAEKGKVSASSGSAVMVHVTGEIKAHASSGGHITVTGNPSVRDTDSSSGGSIHFK
jgi:hypothetical protein